MCADLLSATGLMVFLMSLEDMEQVLVPAPRAHVEMTIQSFDLPWKVLREEFGMTVVLRKEEGQ